MKIIYTNLITSVTSSATQLASDYAIAKVGNNYPKQPYISDAATATNAAERGVGTEFYVPTSSERNRSRGVLKSHFLFFISTLS